MTDNTPEATPPVIRESLWSRMSRGFRRGAIRLENSASFMYLRAISRAGIILIAIGFFLNLDDRQAATKSRAWQTLTSTAPGNVGKADAMGEPLNRIDATRRLFGWR